MNKSEAKQLDTILELFTAEDWHSEVESENIWYCDKLEALGYIEIISRSEGLIMLTKKGNEFKARTSFVSQFEDGKLDRKGKKWTVVSSQTAFWTAIASIIISIASFLWQFFK